MRRIIFILFLTLSPIVVILLPISAYASDVPVDPTDSRSLSAFFTPPDTDVSVDLLGKIFGIVGNNLSGNALIMGEIFKVFNLAILSLAGFLLVYILFVSTLNTAHEGEFMGKDWHSIWIPLRTVFAIGLMVPGTMGYNAMQVMVIWLVIQGIGAADRIWNVALDHVMSGQPILQSEMKINTDLSGFDAVSGNGDNQNMGTRVGQMLTAASCMRSLQTSLQERRDQQLKDKSSVSQFKGSCSGSGNHFWCSNYPDFAATVNILDAQSRAPDDRVIVNFPSFNSTSSFAALNGVCGSVSFDKINRSQVESNIGANFSDSTRGANVDNLTMARAVALQQVYLDMSRLSERMVSNQAAFSDRNQNSTTLPIGEPLDDNTTWGVAGGGSVALLQGGEIQSSAQNYYNILTPTLNLLMNGNANSDSMNVAFANQARRDGWILAGAYYWNIALADRNQNQFFNDLDSFSIDTGSSGAISNNNAIKDAVSHDALSQGQLNLINAFLGNTNDSSYIGDPSNTVSKYISNAIQFGFTSTNQARSGENTSPQLATLVQTSNAAGDVNNVINNMIGDLKDSAGRIHGGIFNWQGGVGGILKVGLDIAMLFLQAIVVAVNEILNYLSQVFTGILMDLADVVEKTINQDINPLIGLTQLGNAMVNTAVTLWSSGLIIAVILFGGSQVPFVGGLLGLLMFVVPVVFAVISMLFVFGMVLAYYLPLLPYFIFALGGIAWLIGVIEAMCAAPIVAMGLMYPDGHKILGFAGDQTIKLLLNVFLRPSMMVIGFIAAILLSAVGVQLINLGFYQAVSIVVGSTDLGNGQILESGGFQFIFSGGGFVGGIAVVCIYVWLVWTIVEKSCELIHIIPDKVLRWLSGGFQDSLGQETAGMVRGMKDGMTRGAEQVAGAAASYSHEDQINKRVGGGGGGGGGEAGGGAAGGGAVPPPV